MTSRQAAAEPQASLIVYVHGIGQDDSREILKSDWDHAVFGRDAGERTRMAYWADITQPVGGSTPFDPFSVARRSQPASAVRVLQQANVPLTPASRAYAESLMATVLQRGGLVPRGAGALAVSPLGWSDDLARLFMEMFLKDSAQYFFKPHVRKAIRQRLLDELPSDGRPVTIVGHSLGSVIAYEALSLLAEGAVNLRSLITIGSPLGMPVVQAQLQPAPSMPRCVRKWSNFADPLDPVAAGDWLDVDFGSAQTKIDDQSIANLHRFPQLNPHSAIGYLSHAKVYGAVGASSGMDMMARFVLARDVARNLGSPASMRFPVLIEPLEPGFNALYETDEERGRAEAIPGAPLTLDARIHGAAADLAQLVGEDALAATRIDPLRRYVAAHLTSRELGLIAQLHQEMRVYAVWRSAAKRKLTGRSARTLKADAALASFRADGTGVTWAVLDTGIRGSHPHFEGVIQAVWDCTKPGAPRRIDARAAKDPDGHGTHVAGIIAGAAPRDKPAGKEREERGMAPKARLVVYKVLDDSGDGEDASIIKALDHIALANENASDGLAIHGVNLSLGGPFDPAVYGCGFSPICSELRRLWRAGVLVVVACGNEGHLRVGTPRGDIDISADMSIGDPANLEDCIAVGSVHAEKPHLYGVSWFSSRGPTSDGRCKPDVVAPGERICSCNANYKDADDYYFQESGTSMAAPHVSGLLAAFLSVRPEFRGRPDEVKRILMETCTDLGRDRYHQGRGVPNLVGMLMAV